MIRRVRRAAATIVGALLLLLGLAAPAAADTTPLWRVTIDVRPDGSFEVVEEITQDFTQKRRGIFRYLPVAERIAEGGLVEVPDGDPGDWFQRIRVDDIEVSSPNAPDETLVERPSRHDSTGVLSIRIGEEDTFLTGTRDYRIRYVVEGALLPGGDGTTLLRWDVVGDGWQQPIGAVEVVVTGPGLLADRAVCAGPGCSVDVAEAGRWVASTGPVPAFTPVSVQVPFDATVLPAPEPILQRRWTFADALAGDGRAIPLALMSLLSLVFVGRLLFREGRDREARGDVTVDGRTDTTHRADLADGPPRPLGAPRIVPVEYRPPDDLRPGQLGLLVDERVDPVDVSATVVDLAVRGHLVIEEEVTKKAWWTTTDWRLRDTGKSRGDLPAWERYLLDGLFDGRDEVLVSDLKGTFSKDYTAVEKALYEDGHVRGWFARRPDKARERWLGIGIAAFLAAFGLFVAALYFTRVAIAAVPLVVAGLVLVVGHQWMPRRTSRGSALLTRTLGFREFIETAEADRARFAEQEHLFVEYLPYAVVFGATEKWARAFEGLGVLTAEGGAGLGTWYVWHGGGMFDARAFSAGLGDFSTTMGTAAVTAPPSSGGGGGGFSGGGGFGGGGGGSW